MVGGWKECCALWGLAASWEVKTGETAKQRAQLVREGKGGRVNATGGIKKE